VRVQPGCARDAVTAASADPPSITVKVRAAAREGEANLAAIRVLSTALGVAGSAVTIWRGAAARRKLVRVCLPPEQLRVRLEKILETTLQRKAIS